jgi:hypothetical protein
MTELNFAVLAQEVIDMLDETGVVFELVDERIDVTPVIIATGSVLHRHGMLNFHVRAICPDDTDGDGNCAKCARDPLFHIRGEMSRI